MRIRILPAGELESIDKALVVDARREHEFRLGHIPGAILLGWEHWCEPAPSGVAETFTQPGYWGVLGEIAGERLAAQGLRHDRPIVVYAGGARSRGREGRVAWMLLYLGASQVHLLDGGWNGWLAANGAVETDRSAPAAGYFETNVQPDRRRTLDELRGAMARSQMPLAIDTRSSAEYAGSGQDYLSRRGRLPATVSFPFDQLFGSTGAYIGKDAYYALLPAALLNQTAAFAYCEVGVRAALFALLHEAYTGRVMPVFDGSFVQWSLQENLPVETGIP